MPLKMIFIYFVKRIWLLSILMASCGINHSDKQELGEDKNKASGKMDNIRKLRRHVSISSPSPNDRITYGEDVSFRLEVAEKAPDIDSVMFYVDAAFMEKKSGEEVWEFHWLAKEVKMGKHNLRAVLYFEKGTKLSKNVTVEILSDTKPQPFNCHVVNVYPHDVKDYTQGLVFYNGYLYEGTGQNGESVLKRTNIETGQVMQSVRLSDEYFGEGISIFNDRLIQLTWTSRVGFVYNLETFELVNKVYYQTQGWGLTTNGQKLIMSDGSNALYFLDPEYFTEEYTVYVYDDRGPVMNLNELEYIKGKVYANVYQTDDIVIIDPETGKVTGKIDCQGLLKPQDMHEKIDVLNGIAYDEKNDKIYLTGKRWPKLFEVTLRGDS